jgi:hypothetical protein
MTTLSPDTLSILKNFATINSNLVVKPGEPLSTISEAKNIMAIATIVEAFPQQFGIYDLTGFLSAIDLVGEPDLDFSEDSVVLSSGKSKVKYRFADESILTTPSKKINMPNADVTVEVTADSLNKIRKAGGALGHSVVSITGKDGVISLAVLDPKNPTANSFSIVIDDNNASKASFDLQFLISNLKVIAGNYVVEISSKLISHWKNQSVAVEYFIALEKTSTFEA